MKLGPKRDFRIQWPATVETSNITFRLMRRMAPCDTAFRVVRPGRDSDLRLASRLNDQLQAP